MVFATLLTRPKEKKQTTIPNKHSVDSSNEIYHIRIDGIKGVEILPTQKKKRILKLSTLGPRMDFVTEHEKIRIFWGHAASLVWAWTLAKGLCFSAESLNTQISPP